MATAGSWSTNWATGKVTTTDGKWWDSNGSWYDSTESVPSSAFSYSYFPKNPKDVEYLWFDEKNNKLEMLEKGPKDHLLELEELFDI